MFGSSAGFAPAFDLAALDGSNGFRLDGIGRDDQSGFSVAGAGDVNGDGIGDLIVGASRADPDGKSSAGESYVVFGSSAGFAASLDLASLDGSNGYRLVGIDSDDLSGSFGRRGGRRQRRRHRRPDRRGSECRRRRELPMPARAT